jgi:hypothetical protein
MRGLSGWGDQTDRGTVSMLLEGSRGRPEPWRLNSRSDRGGEMEGAHVIRAAPRPGKLPATAGPSSQPHGQRAFNAGVDRALLSLTPPVEREPKPLSRWPFSAATSGTLWNENEMSG